MSAYNDLLLIIFMLITVPCFTYWMGYRSGEKSGQLNAYKDLHEKSASELEGVTPISDPAV